MLGCRWDRLSLLPLPSASRCLHLRAASQQLLAPSLPPRTSIGVAAARGSRRETTARGSRERQPREVSARDSREREPTREAANARQPRETAARGSSARSSHEKQPREAAARRSRESQPTRAEEELTRGSRRGACYGVVPGDLLIGLGLLTCLSLINLTFYGPGRAVYCGADVFASASGRLS